MLYDDKVEVFDNAAGVDKFYVHKITLLIWKQKSKLWWEKIHYDGTHTFSKRTNCNFAYLMGSYISLLPNQIYHYRANGMTDITLAFLKYYHTKHVLDCTYTCILCKAWTFYTNRYI